MGSTSDLDYPSPRSCYSPSTKPIHGLGSKTSSGTTTSQQSHLMPLRYSGSDLSRPPRNHAQDPAGCALHALDSLKTARQLAYNGPIGVQQFPPTGPRPYPKFVLPALRRRLRHVLDGRGPGNRQSQGTHPPGPAAGSGDSVL